MACVVINHKTVQSHIPSAQIMVTIFAGYKKVTQVTKVRVSSWKPFVGLTHSVKVSRNK